MGYPPFCQMGLLYFYTITILHERIEIIWTCQPILYWVVIIKLIEINKLSVTRAKSIYQVELALILDKTFG